MKRQKKGKGNGSGGAAGPKAARPPRPSFSIRLVEESDLDAILEAEKLRWSYPATDEDFGDYQGLRPWAMGRDAVLEVISRREDAKLGTWHTTAFAIQKKVRRTTDQGNRRTVDLVVGGFALEFVPGAVELAFFSVHPEDGKAEAFAAIIDFLVEKTRMSAKLARKKAVVRLRDRDEAGLREWVPVLQEKGFKGKLTRNAYDNGDDGWIFSMNA